MKKISSFLLSLALITLLAACGSASPDNHESHENTEHGEHAGHSEENTEIKTEALWEVENGQAKEEALINIKVQNEEGKAVETFDLNHEKLMHLILVSKDLSYFNHIHPEYEKNGRFQVENEFPAGGEYKAFADYIPANGTQQVKSEWLKIEGEQALEQPLEADAHLTKEAGGKEVTLTFDHLKQKENVTMTFTIKDAVKKEPITNLEPYLGAVGHVVVLDGKAETYLHVHPLDEAAKGPEAVFSTVFPSSGIYKIWGQFQHEGKVFTVPFVIEVP